MPLHLTLLWLAACDDGATGDPSVPVLDPDLQLGTGIAEYVPITDGDEMIIVFGPQGGYHLDGSLRVQGIDPGDDRDLSSPRNPVTIFQVFREDGSIVSGLEGADTIEFRQGISPAETPGVYEMVGRKILLDITDDSELEGQTLTVTVEVEDADGLRLTDEHTVTAVASFYND